MTSEKTEVVRAFVDAFNRADWDAALEHAAPGFEIDLSRAMGPYRGVYGLDQLRPFLAEFAETWDSLRIDADELLTAGDNVVGTWALHVRGRDGLETQSRVTWVMEVREGALARATMYQDREEGLAAAGVTERNTP
jgi:ketosteroid isomerase-like protein